MTMIKQAQNEGFIRIKIFNLPFPAIRRFKHTHLPYPDIRRIVRDLIALLFTLDLE